MSESASQLDGLEEEELVRKPNSRERMVSGKESDKDGEQRLPSFFTNYQRDEFSDSFPKLYEVMMNDLEAEPSTSGGILGSQEDWNRLENTMNFVDFMALSEREAREAYYQKIKGEEAPCVPPLSEIEKTKMGIRNYLHAIDVLKYQPGDDPDAFLEDQKDRRRINPIAKQTARRLSVIFDEAKRRFPDEFVEREIPIPQESLQVHPTSMLPPANPQLRDDLLTELGTIQKEQK